MDKSLYETRPRLWDCDNSSRLCRHEGVLTEVMDVLAGMFNFTYTVDADPGGDWGVVPVRGSFEDEARPILQRDLCIYKKFLFLFPLKIFEAKLEMFFLRVQNPLFSWPPKNQRNITLTSLQNLNKLVLCEYFVVFIK